MSQPNVVYLMTDQQKASACSVYGNGLVQSPFMDLMASQGVAFANAYAPSAICSPSRASVMTGVHPLVHGVTCHQNRAPYNLRQLPEFLQGAGYFTAGFGHYEAERSLTRGWHEQVANDQTGVLRTAMMHWFGLGRRDVGWSSGSQGRAAESAHAAVLTDRVVHALDVLSHYQPFFLHVAYLEPHPPYFAPPPFDNLIDPASVELPSRGEPGSPLWQEVVREQAGTSQATDADIRRMIAVYYGMISYADSQMARLYEELRRRGLVENTWIIVASDHGDYLGEKGIFAKSESLYECLLHVPLIIRPPDAYVARRGELIEDLVDLTDLFSTILTLADISVPSYAQGKDLSQWMSTTERSPLRDCVFAQVGLYGGSLGTTFPGGMAAGGRHKSLLEGVRTREVSYVRDPDYGDEAYDLLGDPRELDNLLRADRRRESKEVEVLQERVDAWHAECVELRERLGVIRGYDGFEEGQ